MSEVHASPQSTHVLRFAGDSGDGIQLQGQQFTVASALGGNDLATMPDFPAEIRAPAGTRYGVSAFQIQFGGERITTPGDAPDVLIAFNPAALVVNLPHLAPGALVLVDAQAFTEQRLKRADLDSNPLDDGSLNDYRVVPVDVSRLTQEAVKPFGLGTKRFPALQELLGARAHAVDVRPTPGALDPVDRAALRRATSSSKTPIWRRSTPAMPTAKPPSSRTCWPSTRPRRRRWRPPSTAPSPAPRRSPSASSPPASWRTGDALLLLPDHPGVGAAASPGRPPQAAASPRSRPRTRSPPPAAAIGASYAGKLGITSSSGPGLALKTEAIGLAMATELPLVIVDSQRAGPSTGMPTKTEQSDLYQAVYGRNGDAARAGGGGPVAGRLLRDRHRSGPHRAQAHDARDPADRRLPRQCVGAVAHPRHRPLPAPRDAPGRTPRATGGVFRRNPATRRGCGRCPATGASSPHRRPRERHRRPATSPTTRRITRP